MGETDFVKEVTPHDLSKYFLKASISRYTDNRNPGYIYILKGIWQVLSQKILKKTAGIE